MTGLLEEADLDILIPGLAAIEPGLSPKERILAHRLTNRNTSHE